MPFYVYLLRCSDGSFYTGLTSDLALRIFEHVSGADPKSYTFTRRPVKLVWSGEFNTHDEAFRFEHQVKGWSHAKKEALIQEDWQKVHQVVQEERKRREFRAKDLKEI